MSSRGSLAITREDLIGNHCRRLTTRESLPAEQASKPEDSQVVDLRLLKMIVQARRLRTGRKPVLRDTNRYTAIAGAICGGTISSSACVDGGAIGASIVGR